MKKEKERAEIVSGVYYDMCREKWKKGEIREGDQKKQKALFGHD